MAKIFIDNVAYEVDGSQNLLAACLSLGLNLTYFCWHPALHSVGACRQCGILKYRDENDTKGRIMMACMEPAAEGTRISIEAPQAREFRAANIEALMINHPHDCPVCDEGGECHLQDMTLMSGHNYRRYRFKKRTHTNQYLGPFINHEMNRCIQCYRCVRFYNDYAGGKDFSVFAAHDDVYFGRYEPGVLESEFSGNLVEVCPTGVFTDKTLKQHYTRKWDLTNAPSVCHQCGLGCNILAGERYGTIRRILSRFNGDVNGYFLCDRGRFGYEYVNSEKRIPHPLKKKDGVFQGMEADAMIEDLKKLTSAKGKMMGIGSPRASLESNFLLRELVGPENFYAGVPKTEGKLLKTVIDILRDGRVRTPSMSEAATYDAVFILGEDITNTAPMLALSIRQAAKNKPREKTKAMKIADWNDAAIREIVQGEKGPLFIAAVQPTKLEEIATNCYHGHPDGIARLGAAVAHNINDQLPGVDLDTETETLAATVAEALLAAKKPLIVSGTGLYNEAILHAAANLAYALKDQDKAVGLIYAVPEVNSIGLALMADRYLEDAFEEAKAAPVATTVILENDLYQRMDKDSVDDFFNRSEDRVVLDCLAGDTGLNATYVLPAGTFAESDGTVVNNEGRAQRFYQVHVPKTSARSSWKWLNAIVQDGTRNFDGIVENMIKVFPIFQEVKSVAPSADYRKGTEKIPREPHRYSGRTAMHANENVSEPKPPSDPDSALSFTMEGYLGKPPSSIIPFFWSPGWNSVQAINKYQIEVGGALHGGNPGKRLFESSPDRQLVYFKDTPQPFSPQQGRWCVLPLYHIYGSDELSAQSTAVKQRIPAPYIALNDQDAKEGGYAKDDQVELFLGGRKHAFPVVLEPGLPRGIAGLPKGLEQTKGVLFPFWTELKHLKNE
ncbi:MAG TPA: NADH-quinone oxidoreductase subunit NuoG [Chitinophagaceae bacterium]|nr:NADH-quinone oxidoreductase subunit NuoG [Chitinophagaceae bacterium]